MKTESFKNKIESWLVTQLTLASDSPEDQALKKRLILYLIPEIPFLGILGICFWKFGLQHVATSMWFFTFVELTITLSFFIIHRKTNLFALINQYFFVLFSFVCVLYFGGIMNSGGIVLVGLAGVLHSLYFLRPSQIRILFIVYIVTIILEAVLQPYLKPLPEITPTANLVLFVLHLLVIAIVLYSWLNFFIQQSIQLKLQETEHLKELDTIKTDFYTNITHEFRTPLTVILGLTNPETKISDSNIIKNVQMIRKNGIRLLQLVNQMLDLSRFEAKAMQLNYIQSDIISYLRQIIEPFNHLSKEKHIALHFHSQLSDLKMDFDPEKVDSLFSNLLSNAIKYSPENSEINFFIDELSTYQKNEFGYSIFPQKQITNQRFLKLSVQDTGYGIMEEELPLIFDRFYKAKSILTKQTNGAGIGLLLVKELVNLLDGNLFITSKPGAGTEIVVLLPITNQAENSCRIKEEWKLELDDATLKDTIPEQDGAKNELPHLLIIEDNNDVAMYLQSITIKNYRIFRAKNGIQGIETALKIIPDVIVSDILMPGKNGFQVCETLKKNFLTSHIPIILLTAKADKASQIFGYKHGADAYISKPFDPQELLVRLQKLIEIRESLKTKYKTLALVPDANSNKIQNADEQFLLKTKSIIENRFSDDNFDTIELSNQLGTSRSQLFRKLKALTGMSATHFIRFYRLSVAKDKILKTSLTVSEIAYEVGFKDPAYFSRVFTKEFGDSPKSTRQKYQC